MKNVTRALIIGLIVMTSIASGNKAAAHATAQTAQWVCCADPPACPGLPMCPIN
ncbi:MAG: hypothetical protein ACJ71W_22200 [Terriglobales bacterium]